MMHRSVKRKLIRARIKLNQTVAQILEINKRRKRLKYLKNAREKRVLLKEELKVLNKTAEHQSRLIRHYENQLTKTE